MHQTKIKMIYKPRLKNPLLIEGLPGVGNVGRVAAGYLIHELRAKKIAELYSPHFLPLVVLQPNSLVHVLNMAFYLYKGRKRDIVILTGDSQSITPYGHYEICGEIINLCKKLKIKEIITLGGFASGRSPKTPRVIGATNSEKLIEKYKKYKIDFSGNHNIGTIVGASGLLLGLGRAENIDGLCLMGETVGFPFLLTDPKAAEAILKVVTKILNIKIDMTKLDESVKEMEESIKKTEKIHQEMLSQIIKERKTPTHYIG
ncbi:MAG: proteasome assembly chaperone family protein [Candidatus Aenigmarchaeota archaeon ex4484_14]|nr:MAG: proteasome assembly chaperone family protein [Candidatus Aenigmarchaeota archaeon ex4484_14]